MLEGLSPGDLISLFSWILGGFLTLITVIVTLYKWNVEKTITAQSDLLHQKIDLTNQLLKSNIEEMRRESEQIRTIAVTAHHAVDTHVLNYHRQG